ncbi:MAG: DnaJ domain-containing protein, partial [Bacteroidota bacterium]|nr:DnaJ domain-containing protein [Bacteroidota bacterium]
MKQDYYEILGISKSASSSEIKKAYRKEAIKYHPDKNPGDKTAEANFKKAAEAYEILSDPDKKSRYDQFGHNAFEGAGGFGAGGMNMEDIFSQFGDIFGSAFGSSFGGFGRSGHTRVRGSNLRIKVKLSLDEIINGVEKKIKVNRKILSKDAKFSNCSVCNGSGQVTKITNTILGRMQSSSICVNCNGLGQSLSHKPSGADSSGMLNHEETVSIKIPPGVEEGMQLKVSGKGNESNNKNASSGDLLV